MDKVRRQCTNAVDFFVTLLVLRSNAERSFVVHLSAGEHIDYAST